MPGRHGCCVARNLRIGFEDFIHCGVEARRERRQGISCLGGVIHQFTGFVGSACWERSLRVKGCADLLGAGWELIRLDSVQR